MHISRRNTLKIIGSGAIILAASSCTGPDKSSSFPDPAAAWHDAALETDVLRFGLAHGLLAPNPHNRQPWMVDLHDSYSASLYVDTDKDLPQTDPFDRQLTIGLGCFLELFAISVSELGYRVEFELFPEGSSAQSLDTRPVAKITIHASNSLKADPLFTHIYNRRSNRSKFAKSLITATDARQIAGADTKTIAGFTTDKAQIEALRQICVTAAKIEFLTPRTYMESVNLMRIGDEEIAQNPDGLAINGPAISLLKRMGIVTRKTLADPASSAFKQGLRQYIAAARTATGFVWIATPTNSRSEQIMAGRAYVRQNLRATQLGIAMHPLSQALQEYPEMQQELIKVHETTKTSGQRLQMLARIGYAKAVNPSPRFPLAAKLTSNEQTKTG